MPHTRFPSSDEEDFLRGSTRQRRSFRRKQQEEEILEQARRTLEDLKNHGRNQEKQA
jgi:hypothetical protein